jgi:hypothetical protein
MDDSLRQKLDEIASFGNRPIRKVSLEKTPETPIWNEWEWRWEESDAQFRERLLNWNKT